MKAVGLIFLLSSGIIIKDQIKIIYFSFWACIYSKLSVENELDRSAMPRDKVILPYIYKESWDGWRTQMALRNVHGQPQWEWGQLSLGMTSSMGPMLQALPSFTVGWRWPGGCPLTSWQRSGREPKDLPLEQLPHPNKGTNTVQTL